MDTTRRFDAERLSWLIERRLRETDRQHEAAAFLKQRGLRVLLDTISEGLKCVEDLPPDYRRALRLTQPVRRRPTRSAFLTPTDSEHQALVLDFDAIVDQVAQLALEQERKQQLSCSLAVDKKAETFAGPSRKVPLQGSLADLEPVHDLSEAYRTPDFSKNRLRPKNFLR